MTHVNIVVLVVVVVVVATIGVDANSCMPVGDADIPFCLGYRGSGAGTDKAKTTSTRFPIENLDTAAKLKYNELTAAGAKFATASDACKETVKAFTCIKFLWPCLASGTFLRDDKLCSSQLTVLTTHCGADTTLDDLGYREDQKTDITDGATMCPLASWSPPSAPASSTTATPTATPTPTATATTTATASASATPSVPASPSGSPAGSASGSASPSPTQNNINGATATVVTTFSVFVMGILGLCTAVLSM